MSMQAVAIMLKAMGLNIDPIAVKVNELVADGTIDRAAAVLKVMAQNGTFEQLVTFAAKLEETNRMLAHIEKLLTEASDYEPSPVPALPGSGRSDAAGPTADHGAGVSGSDEPD